jgi:hypothetical protein
MAAFSHFDYFESRTQFLRGPSASTSRLTARRSIDLRQIVARVRSAAIEALLFAWALLVVAFSLLVMAGFLA